MEEEENGVLSALAAWKSSGCVPCTPSMSYLVFIEGKGRHSPWSADLHLFHPAKICTAHYQNKYGIINIGKLYVFINIQYVVVFIERQRGGTTHGRPISTSYTMQKIFVARCPNKYGLIGKLYFVINNPYL